MNILKNKTVMRLYKYSYLIYRYLNKYLYLASIISFILSLNTHLRSNKIYKSINWLLKIVFLLNVILGTGLIIYFTDFIDPFNSVFSLYSDLIKPYIELIKQYWNNLINFNIEDSVISNMKESNNLKNEIKEGIKEGVREVLNELRDELEEDLRNQAKSNLYQNIALCGSVLFFGYLFFILPGSTENLSSYNWANQSLIEFKVMVKDFIVNFISNPVNPGDGTTPINSNTTSPIISPTNSVLSGSTDTITPNSSVNTSNFKSMQGTQTILDGITIGKLIETTDIISDVLPKENITQIEDGVNKLIKKITD